MSLIFDNQPAGRFLIEGINQGFILYSFQSLLLLVSSLLFIVEEFSGGVGEGWGHDVHGRGDQSWPTGGKGNYRKLTPNKGGIIKIL